MTRILLFLATNLAIVLLIGVTFQILGIDGLLASNGVDMNLNGLLVMSAVIGFGGSIISLFISKWMAKRSMGVTVIDQPSTASEQWLFQTVQMQAQRAGIGMPEVGIFDTPDPNAFATGWNRNNALVAVSTGLMQQMNHDEVEAVLAHEISHIANGDMVTMTLIQGVVNTFVVFFSRVIGHFIDRVILKNQRGYGPGYYIGSIVAQVVLGMLANTIVMAFSRWREYRADAGGAKLAGRHKMISALQRLQQAHEPQDLPDQFAAFGIAGGLGSGIKKLFMSHPPLSERIEALRRA